MKTPTMVWLNEKAVKLCTWSTPSEETPWDIHNKDRRLSKKHEFAYFILSEFGFVWLNTKTSTQVILNEDNPQLYA